MTNIAKLTGALLLATALTACAESAEDTAPVCDRDCLIELTNNYVASLETQDASGVTFSDEVRIVENLQRINAGEGLWAETTGPSTDFSVVVPDEANQTAGWIGMVEREGVPTVVALRLKLDQAGSIVEAEHLYAEVPEERVEATLTNVRAGLTAEVAEDARMDRAGLITIGDSYYDALDDNDGTLTPFAADCQRHENGMITAGPEAVGGFNPDGPPIAQDCEAQLSSKVMSYITSIDNRRVFAADPVTGLVMGLSHFHHPMDFEPYEVTATDGTIELYETGDEMQFEPFDLPAAHIYKVGADGLVHEIEAMGFRAELDAPTVWEDRAGEETAAE